LAVEAEPELDVARAVLGDGWGVEVEAGAGVEVVITGRCVSGAAVPLLATEVSGL
jgi:hypothetical protein